MQEVENAAEDGQQQQTRYDHHYDHPIAFSCTNAHTDEAITLLSLHLGIISFPELLVRAGGKAVYEPPPSQIRRTPLFLKWLISFKVLFSCISNNWQSVKLRLLYFRVIKVAEHLFSSASIDLIPVENNVYISIILSFNVVLVNILIGSEKV